MNDQISVTQEQVIEALKNVEDPELFLDVWFLGLIYNIGIDGNVVDIEMTFTTPACPAAPMIINDIKGQVGEIEGVEKINIDVTFTPPWEPSDDVKAMLGMM